VAADTRAATHGNRSSIISFLSTANNDGDGDGDGGGDGRAREQAGA